MRIWWMQRKRKHILRYRVFRPLASLLPEKVLRWLERHWKLYYDPSDAWTFWTDASYYKWCRKDKRRAKHTRHC
jgi:hypothetical protein